MTGLPCQCRRCGTAVAAEAAACPDCGAIRMGVLRLSCLHVKGTGATIRIQTPVGRTLLRCWLGPHAPQGLPEQAFTLDPDPETGWSLRSSGHSRQVNVNGRAVDAGIRVPLSTGDVISVGPHGADLAVIVDRAAAP